MAQFFDVSSVWDLDSYQVSLAHWVNVYSSIYELPEDDRPSDAVIHDDLALDLWFKNRGKGQRGSSGTSITNHKASRTIA